MPNAWVVLYDNNPLLIAAAFFGAGAEEAATDWRDVNAGGAAVREARFSSYQLVVNLP